MGGDRREGRHEQPIAGAGAIGAAAAHAPVDIGEDPTGRVEAGIEKKLNDFWRRV